jgi:hypothetical protein
MEHCNDGRMEKRKRQNTVDRRQDEKLRNRTNHESTKKELIFHITPSSFVLSYLRVFVVSC